MVKCWCTGMHRSAQGRSRAIAEPGTAPAAQPQRGAARHEAALPPSRALVWDWGSEEEQAESVSHRNGPSRGGWQRTAARLYDVTSSMARRVN